MTTKKISQCEYLAAFEDKEKEALEQALDIRKFEIDLYWKRAAYFWTFIGAALVGFLAVQTFDADIRHDMSVLLSCLGVVFSFAWLLVNRGSKYWQENWEKHVDMLEDKVTGPLYKVVLSRKKLTSWKEQLIHLITGPSAFSVSKVNQIISLFVFILWVIILIYSLSPFSLTAAVNLFYCALVGLTVACCAMLYFLGRTYEGSYLHSGVQRTSQIRLPDETKSNPDQLND